MFISFEGGDGVGKSTQIALLAQRLREAGRDVLCTREPGGSPNLGSLVRQVLLHGGEVGDQAEALLFAADRAEHVRLVIRPALSRGQVVVTDRFDDSSVVYQGAGRGLGVETIEWLAAFATLGLRPDLVLVLGLDPQTSLQRQVARSGADRIEAAGLGATVDAVLRSRAEADPQRYVRVDARGSVDEVAARVWEAVSARLQGV